MSKLRHKLTLMIGNKPIRYDILFDAQMRWPHLNKDLIDALKDVPGVVMVRPRGNFRGFTVNTEIPPSPRKHDLFNRVYGTFKRFGYELEECG